MKKGKLETITQKDKNTILQDENSGMIWNTNIISSDSRFFKSKEDIFKSIRSEGFTPQIEYEETFEIEGEFSTVMEVALFCPHGHSEHSRTYDKLKDGTWEHVEDSWGFPCPDCEA